MTKNNSNLHQAKRAKNDEFYTRYEDIVDIAKKYINNIGGFEKFAEWGLIRPE